MKIGHRADADVAHGRPSAAGRPFEFLVTSYMLGAPDGKNLGAPGYSHEFVARLFRPVLEQWGDVISVRNPRADLQAAVAAARSRGREPVHFSVLPFQDMPFADGAANIAMPAWEFPDVPNEGFDNNPQNDWPPTADRCDLVLVSGPFTEAALRRGGTRAPIELVPVPTPDACFQLQPWTPDQTTTIDCWAFDFPPTRADEPPAQPKSRPAAASRGKALEKLVRSAAARAFGDDAYRSLSQWIKRRRTHRRRTGKGCDFRRLNYPQVDKLHLSGVVYTSVFAPGDDRKNWQDLLTAFLDALGDEPGVTLVLKLIAKNRSAVSNVIRHYQRATRRHACRIVIICDFLSDAQMLQLCQASTFYVQASRAEGNCLPLMNYLAAGRPGITPVHSSMSDYFDPGCGFVVESHPEPASWPHERELRFRTTRARIVWPSLRDQIAASRKLADDVAAYATMSTYCRSHMWGWAGYPAVAARLEAALRRLCERKGWPIPATTSPPAAVVRAA
jgi:hypothetical protein